LELIPFSPQSKHVILFTTEEADQLLHDSITAGHLLLGILRHGTSAAADTLSRSGLTLGSVREALRRSKGAVEHAFVYVIEDITPALLKSLKENPEHLHDVTPEKFEHLAADRLVRMGFDVMLTGATNRKDGGVDIIAAKRDPAVGNFLIAAQVKHHRGSQKVRREDVDRLISLKGGIFSFGLLVTNTTFTQDAK
jgi:restriction endonuclease Mrr